MISRFFVDRPVFANVIAIVTIILGIVAIRKLPVEQYPPITPPTVQVSTTYPGANAQVVADTVRSEERRVGRLLWHGAYDPLPSRRTSLDPPFLGRWAGFPHRQRDRPHHPGDGGAPQTAGGAVPADHPADRPGQHHLPRGQRPGGRRHR